MREEEFGPITDHELYEAICTGEVIESYPDDAPYPSVLIFGTTNASRPLHTVCAYSSFTNWSSEKRPGSAILVGCTNLTRQRFP